ncbi:hypothetical protein RJ640_018932 [Escallonia rubra]|uniref:Histone deacetylase complex subunit SAP30 Sin3 binding domain-containing protein n=1 Tax=Escallonia rubra TaxID=112253 RepID=A0AA88UGZ4_9ASTE|nr:hypothetical protein RJ640_018932 [Escallonia rubra]
MRHQLMTGNNSGDMLEPELFSSRVFSPFREESGDEELAVLPRHTKVVVTGNNRTKSVLVGLQGVVKKAVGLGGWHWLVLKNGVEVKLQRNALSVVEPPTGNEEDDDYDFDISSSGSDICEKDNGFSSNLEFRKLSKPRVRYIRPWNPSSSTKSLNRGSCNEVQSIIHSPQPHVNLARLGTRSLCRYWRSFNLGRMDPNPSRDQLATAVQHHFASQQVDEVQVIVDFLHAAKRHKSVGTRRERLE